MIPAALEITKHPNFTTSVHSGDSVFSVENNCKVMKNIANVSSASSCPYQCSAVANFTNSNLNSKSNSNSNSNSNLNSNSNSTTYRMHFIDSNCAKESNFCEWNLTDLIDCTKETGSVRLTFWLYLLLRSLGSITVAVTFVLFDAILLELIKQYHGDYGMQRFWQSLGGALAPPLAGLFIDLASRGSERTNYCKNSNKSTNTVTHVRKLLGSKNLFVGP